MRKSWMEEKEEEKAGGTKYGKRGVRRKRG